MKCRVLWHLIRVYTVCYYTLLGLVTRRIDIGAYERQKVRPACTFAKSDQPLYFSYATTLLEMQTLVRSNIMQHLIYFLYIKFEETICFTSISLYDTFCLPLSSADYCYEQIKCFWIKIWPRKMSGLI